MQCCHDLNLTESDDYMVDRMGIICLTKTQFAAHCTNYLCETLETSQFISLIH